MNDEEVYEAIAEAVDEYYSDNGFEDVTIRAGTYKKLYEISGDKDYLYEFERLCKKHNICPKCLIGRMNLECVGHDRYEAWGEVFSENVYEMVCDECGYREE